MEPQEQIASVTVHLGPIPKTTREQAAKAAAEALLGPTVPEPMVQAAADNLSDSALWNRAVEGYNREQTAAYGRFKAASDKAWMDYNRAIQAANLAYDSDMITIGAVYDQTLISGGR